MNRTICHCKNTSLETIESAIANGAKSLADIQHQTGACTGHQCKELNPTGKCCSAEINAILKQADSSKSGACGCCG